MHHTARDPWKMDDLEVIARTVFGEARGEPDIGKVAVAAVIKNRCDNPRWWGRTYKEVCLRHFAFTVWTRKDENHNIALNTLATNTRLYETLKLCAGVFNGRIGDPTNNCDHYCRTDVAHRTPWAIGKTPVVVIGNHSFYRLELKENQPDETFFANTDEIPNSRS